MSERIVQLERNAVNNAQYHRRQSLEINPVPASIGDDVLKSSACEALSLTGHGVKPHDLQPCHCLKEKDTATVKCKLRSKNITLSSKERTSVINQMFSLNLITQRKDLENDRNSTLSLKPSSNLELLVNLLNKATRENGNDPERLLDL